MKTKIELRTVIDSITRDDLKKLSEKLAKYSTEEGIEISSKEIAEEFKIAANNILIVGNKISPDFTWYFKSWVLDCENISDVAHDLAVERGEDKRFGICLYKKEGKINYVFSASNDVFQVTEIDSIDLWKHT